MVIYPISYKQGMRKTKNSANNPKNWKFILHVNFVFNDYYLLPTKIHNNKKKKTVDPWVVAIHKSASILLYRTMILSQYKRMILYR